MLRGRVSLEANVVKWAFRGWHLDLFATTRAELSEDETTKLVRTKTSLGVVNFDHTAMPRRKKVRKRSAFVTNKKAGTRISIGGGRKALRRMEKAKAKAKAARPPSLRAASPRRSVRRRRSSIAAPTPSLASIRRESQLAILGVEDTEAVAQEEAAEGEATLFYRDSADAVQGPFPRSHLIYWVEQAFFDPTTTMASLDATEWVVLADLLEQTADGAGDGESGESDESDAEEQEFWCVVSPLRALPPRLSSGLLARATLCATLRAHPQLTLGDPSFVDRSTGTKTAKTLRSGRSRSRTSSTGSSKASLPPRRVRRRATRRRPGAPRRGPRSRTLSTKTQTPARWRIQTTSMSTISYTNSQPTVPSLLTVTNAPADEES
jgi:hypothetical protein